MYRNYFPPIRESVKHLKTLLDLERNPRLRPRLEMLFLIRSGQVRTRRQLSNYLDVHRNTVTRWLAAYEQGGLAELMRIGPRTEREPASAPTLSRIEQP